MPESDSTLLVVEPNSGHRRQTRNWILGRLWRDYHYRLDGQLKHETPHDASKHDGHDEKQGPPPAGAENERKDGQVQKPPFEALRVTVFELEDEGGLREQGLPVLDLVWFMGLFVIALQLGIAAIPWGTNGQWDTFLITAAGNLFAVISGSLSQWRREKWACPKNGGQTVAITEGNGSRSVIVILKKPGVGLDLEILAQGTRTSPALPLTRFANSVLALLWIVLLITVEAISQNTWCKLYSCLLSTPCPCLFLDPYGRFVPANSICGDSRSAEHWLSR